MSDVEFPRFDGPVPPPQFTNEQIIFHCPQGHRLVVKSAHAGKRGRCDRRGCGASVVVPVPPATGDVVERAPEVDTEPVEAGMPAAPHETSAVAAADVEAGPTAGEPVAGQVADGGDEPEADGWGFIGGGPQPPALPSGGGSVPASTGAATSVRRDGGPDTPTARLLDRLWQERDHGGIVELHLTGGSVVLPEWYERDWSRGTHGLFASQAPDGTVTLTAVAWDSIQKVVVRHVRDLPDGFE